MPLIRKRKHIQSQPAPAELGRNAESDAETPSDLEGRAASDRLHAENMASQEVEERVITIDDPEIDQPIDRSNHSVAEKGETFASKMMEFAEAEKYLIKRFPLAYQKFVTDIPVGTSLNSAGVQAILVRIPENRCLRDLGVDSYGHWTCKTAKMESRSWFYTFDAEFGELMRISPMKRKENSEYDVKLTQQRYKHPAEKLFLKTVYSTSFSQSIGQDMKEEICLRGGYSPNWAIVIYKWGCTPYRIARPAHGNSKDPTTPFQRNYVSKQKLWKDALHSSDQLPGEYYHQENSRKSVFDERYELEVPRSSYQIYGLSKGRKTSRSRGGRPSKQNFEEVVKLWNQKEFVRNVDLEEGQVRIFMACEPALKLLAEHGLREPGKNVVDANFSRAVSVEVSTDVPKHYLTIFSIRDPRFIGKRNREPLLEVAYGLTKDRKADDFAFISHSLEDSLREVCGMELGAVINAWNSESEQALICGLSSATLFSYPSAHSTCDTQLKLFSGPHFLPIQELIPDLHEYQKAKLRAVTCAIFGRGNFRPKKTFVFLDQTEAWRLKTQAEKMDFLKDNYLFFDTNLEEEDKQVDHSQNVFDSTFEDREPQAGPSESVVIPKFEGDFEKELEVAHRKAEELLAKNAAVMKSKEVRSNSQKKFYIEDGETCYGVTIMENKTSRVVRMKCSPHCTEFKSLTYSCRHCLAIAEIEDKFIEHILDIKERNGSSGTRPGSVAKSGTKRKAISLTSTPRSREARPAQVNAESPSNAAQSLTPFVNKPAPTEEERNALLRPAPPEYFRPWHNDEMFKVAFLPPKVDKVCRSCGVKFPSLPKDQLVSPADLIITHKEPILLKLPDGTWSAMRGPKCVQQAFLHPRYSCIKNRYPYFWVGRLEIPSEVKERLDGLQKERLWEQFGWKE